MKANFIRDRLSSKEREKRDRELIRDFNMGKKRSDLVAKYGISTTQIYNIVHREEGSLVVLD